MKFIFEIFQGFIQFAWTALLTMEHEVVYVNTIKLDEK